MKNRALEPGILQIFRLFVAFRTVIFVISLLSGLFIADSPFAYEFDWLFLVSVLNTIVLLIYLLWRWPQKVLRSAYFPIAIVFVSVGTILESFLMQQTMDQAHFGVFFQPFIYLFMPLVLIAWQYNLLTVIIFTFGSALLDAGLLLLSDITTISSMVHVGLVFTRTITFLFVGYMVSRLVSLQRAQKHALTEANQALEKANIRLVQHSATIEQLSISQERNRMARELHDVVAHTLSGLAVQLDAVSSLWDSIPPKAQKMIDQALSTTRSGLNETRRAMQNLRASPLEEMGLGLAVRTLAEDAAERACFSLDMDIQDHMENLSHDVEQGFYRTAQEALENIIRHAQATHVQISLKMENNLMMTIQDNGRGYETNQAISTGQFGIVGMQERAGLIGAQLEISSQPQRGTRVRLTWEKTA